MKKDDLDFLTSLLESPGPSGYEGPIQEVVRKRLEPVCDELRTDWHGNVIGTVNPAGPVRILLDGHCDQIGLIVNYVDERGFLSVEQIGGWDVQMLIGQRVRVWTANGPVLGVIARKAIHLLTPDERKKVPEMKDLWIDLGVQDAEQAKELVSVGDPVTLDLGMHPLQNDLACAPGMDDRVGVWVAVTATLRAAERNPTAAIHCVSAVQEEIGLRGTKTSAFTVDPHIGIAIDVTHATDCPNLDPRQYGLVEMGKGPVVTRGSATNPVVFTRLTKIAKDKSIPLQVQAAGKAVSNDANALQVNRGGVATAAIGIPNRYMHSPVEVVSLGDLDHAADLLAEFCLSVTPDCDFTP